MPETFSGEAVTAGAEGKAAGHPAHGGDADASAVVDLAVGAAFGQLRDHRPAVGHGLELGRGAQVDEEAPEFVRRLERAQGANESGQTAVRGRAKVRGGNHGNWGAIEGGTTLHGDVM